MEEFVAPGVFKPEDLVNLFNEISGEKYLVGDALKVYSSFFNDQLLNWKRINEAYWYPKASSFFNLIQIKGEGEFNESILPLYLRVSDAEKSIGMKWKLKK